MADQVLQSYPILSTYNDSSVNSQSILDVFVLQDIIDYEDAENLKRNFKTNREIEQFLIKNRLVTRDTINKAYSILLKIPYVGLQNIEIPEVARNLITKQVADKYGIIPFSVDGKVVRMAISRPSDLLAGYTKGLIKVFESKNLLIELFITGEADFRDAISQYDKKNKKVLMKKGSLPVIYLRNLKIPRQYLVKIPKEYIEKYRVIVFAENVYGGYMIACQEPDSIVTKKVLDYIQKENNIRLEAFAASKDDFDHVIQNYQSYLEGKNVLPLKDEKRKDEEDNNIVRAKASNQNGVKEKSQDNANSNSSNKKAVNPDDIFSFEKLFSSGEKNNSEAITIDSVMSEDEASANEVIDSQNDPSDKNLNKKLQEAADQEKAAISGNKVEETSSIEIKEDNSTANKEEKTVETEQKEQDQKINDNPAPTQDESKKDEKKVNISFGGDSLEGQDLGTILQHDVTSEEELDAIIKEGYVPKIVAGIIKYCLNKKVSDIHIEPQPKTLRIRCRIDGVLTEIAKMPLSLHPPIISRVKILSKLKIDETRIPQDGRFAVSFETRDVDVRVSALPTVHGEKLVLRILDKSQKTLSLEDLGFMGDGFDKTMEAIKKPWGILLSTGPTGSGKSTTLNAIISRLNQPGVNISTLEDPVEYETPGVNQSQVKPEIGFTFASGLRSLLRQDPNVIMVGEIRDGETAAMATHAALTGHLVLSTLHTNDTAGALPRLINMGIEPFLITSSMDLIIAQRLVRRVCPKCREEMKIPSKLMEEIMTEVEKIPVSNKKDRERIPADPKVYYGRGCSECNQGYKGRVGLFEVMSMSPEIEEMAIMKRPANEIKASAIKAGMITMKQDGILKALSGQTTLDEVFQATMEN